VDESALAIRLARLERSNRRLRRWLILLTLGVLVGVFVDVCFRPVSVVRAIGGKQYIGSTALGDTAVQGFWNNRGERRLTMGVVSKGYPAINLLGQNDLPRLGIFLNEGDLPSIMLYNPLRSGGIFMDVASDGRPRITLRAPAGEGAIVLGFLPDGNPSIRLVDRDGKHVVDVSSPPESRQTE
jgi:hypothetical protein